MTGESCVREDSIERERTIPFDRGRIKRIKPIFLLRNFVNEERINRVQTLRWLWTTRLMPSREERWYYPSKQWMNLQLSLMLITLGVLGVIGGELVKDMVIGFVNSMLFGTRIEDSVDQALRQYNFDESWAWDGKIIKQQITVMGGPSKKKDKVQEWMLPDLDDDDEDDGYKGIGPSGVCISEYVKEFLQRSIDVCNECYYEASLDPLIWIATTGTYRPTSQEDRDRELTAKQTEVDMKERAETLRTIVQAITVGTRLNLQMRREKLLRLGIAYRMAERRRKGIPGADEEIKREHLQGLRRRHYALADSEYVWQQSEVNEAFLRPCHGESGALFKARYDLERKSVLASMHNLQMSLKRGSSVDQEHDWLLSERFLPTYFDYTWLKHLPSAGEDDATTVLALAVLHVGGMNDGVVGRKEHRDFVMPCLWGHEKVPSEVVVDTGAMLSLMSLDEANRLGLSIAENGKVDYRVVDAGNNSLGILGKIAGSKAVTFTDEKGVEVAFTYDGVTRGSTILVVEKLPCPFLMGLPFLGRNKFMLDTSDLAMSTYVNGSYHRFQGIDGDGKDKIRWISDRSKDTTMPVYMLHDVELLPGFVHRVPLNLSYGDGTPRYFTGNDTREDEEGYLAVGGLLDDGISPCVIMQNLTMAPLLLESRYSIGAVTNLGKKDVYVLPLEDHMAPMSTSEGEAYFNQREQPRKIRSVVVDEKVLYKAPEQFKLPRLNKPPGDEGLNITSYPDVDEDGPLPTGLGIGAIRPEDEGKEATLEVLQSMLDPSMPEAHREKFVKLLLSHRDIWTNSFSAQWDCGEFGVTLKPGASPYKARCFRFPHAQMEPLRKLIDKWLEEGVVEPSNSPWCSSAFFVPKPHGGGLRFVVDYRVLNSNTVEDRFPLPEIQDIFNNFQGHSVFSTFDALSGFNQQSVRMDSRDLTTFVCPLGTFRSTRLSMGLRNGPASFQRGMLIMCKGLWGINVYIDDISVSNGTRYETQSDTALNSDGLAKDEYDIHYDRIKAVLDRCLKHQLRLNPKKCTIGARSVKYLGYIISKDGLAPDPEKVAALETIRTPEDVHDIRVFLGLINYYRSFIPDCALMSIPLNELLNKGVLFVWTERHQRSFEALRKSLSDHCLRNHFVPDAPLELYTDCSDYAMGAVLSQKVEGVDRVLAFFSRTLSGAERNYSVYQKEALAIVSGITYFHQYLVGAHFTVYTDHYSLASILRWKDPPQRIARWIQILDQYTFTAVYKSGSTHANADALSRMQSRYVLKDLPGQLVHLEGVTTIARLDNMMEDVIPPTTVVMAKTSLGEIRVCHVQDEELLSYKDMLLEKIPSVRKLMATKEPSPRRDEECNRLIEICTVNAITRAASSRIPIVASEEAVQLPRPEEHPVERPIQDTSTMGMAEVYKLVGRRFEDPEDSVEYVIDDVYFDDNLQEFVVTRSPFDRKAVASSSSKEPIYLDQVYEYLSNQPVLVHPDAGKQSLIENNVQFRVDVEDSLEKWLSSGVLKLNEVFLFPDEDGSVHYYRRGFNGPTHEEQFQLLIPESERGKEIRNHLLFASHEYSGHLRFGKFIADLHSRVWWPGMYKDAKAHSSSCAACQSRGTANDRQERGIPTQSALTATEPFQNIAIDILGPLHKGKGYVVVAVDQFSRYVEAEAYDNTPTAETVNEFMVQHFYFRHGSPAKITADNGSNLVSNDLNSWLFQSMGSQVRNVTAYHPQANGMVERFNKPICDTLAAYCTKEDSSDWKDKLSATIHALNTSVCRSTGYTPYFLVHGREARRVIDQRLPQNWDHRFKTKNWHDYAALLLARLQTAREVALQNIESAKSVYTSPAVVLSKIRSFRKVSPKFGNPFSEGDWVQVFVPILSTKDRDHNAKKLARFWRGPYQVIKQINPVTYLVNVKGKSVPVHLDRIKAFHSRNASCRPPF